MPSIVIDKVMSFKDEKIFVIFIRLGPPIFNGVVGKDTYEFLIDYWEKLHKH